MSLNLVITVLNTAILLEEREGYIYVQQQTKQEVYVKWQLRYHLFCRYIPINFSTIFLHF